MTSTVLRRLLRIGRVLLLLAIVLWGALALLYALHLSAVLKTAVISLWVAAGLVLLLLVPCLARPQTRAVTAARLVFALALGALALWWYGIVPSQQRDWAPDVARQLAVERDGDLVVLHNVRNFAWHSRDSATPRWETRRYRLSQLASVDMALSYWMGPAIAHTLVSFGFDNGDYLTFSVEIRREQNESFSIGGGFFKQFEVSLIAADENDILRLRSNVRGEDVYLYRVALSPKARRELFLAYLNEAEQLRREPRFYNTLTSNCTTIVYDMVDPIVPGLPRDPRLVLSGYLPEYVEAHGGLAEGYGVDELRRRGHINPRTQRLPENVSGRDWSRAIREGVPGMMDAAAP